METAKVIKEKYGYICPDVAKEFNKYDGQPEKWFKLYESVNSITRKVSVVVVVLACGDSNDGACSWRANEMVVVVVKVV